jgi:hypothetical protein
MSLNEVCNAGEFNIQPSAALHPWWSPFGQTLDAVQHNFFEPFTNPSVFCLMHWFYLLLLMKSLKELQCLANEVINQKDFHQEHFDGFNATWEAKRMDTRAC